jgi:hypothetical protein
MDLANRTTEIARAANFGLPIETCRSAASSAGSLRPRALELARRKFTRQRLAGKPMSLREIQSALVLGNWEHGLKRRVTGALAPSLPKSDLSDRTQDDDCARVQMSFPDAVDGSLLARRATKVAVAALANKIPRMPWAIMARGERYTEPVALAMGFDAGLLAFAMVHCACSSPLFAEASACIVCSPRPLSVRFRRVPAFSGSLINGRKSESDPLRRCPREGAAQRPNPAAALALLRSPLPI